jgi:hypothetical protein
VSTRSDAVAAIVSAVDTVITAAVTVAMWEGEDEAFNPDATYPLIYVEYNGMAFSGNLEQGADTRERVMDIRVHVLTDNSDEALNYLETIEDGISNTSITANSQVLYLDVQREDVQRIWLGKYCYTQYYTATQMRSE